jgi:hypothetical protein
LLGANLGFAVVGAEAWSDGEQVAAFAVDVTDARTVSAIQGATTTELAGASHAPAVCQYQ